jgi:hypothetical protein
VGNLAINAGGIAPNGRYNHVQTCKFCQRGLFGSIFCRKEVERRSFPRFEEEMARL